jgi:hypothetical protein
MFEMYVVLSMLKYLFPSLRVCHSKFQFFGLCGSGLVGFNDNYSSVGCSELSSHSLMLFCSDIA